MLASIVSILMISISQFAIVNTEAAHDESLMDPPTAFYSWLGVTQLPVLN